MTITAAVEPQQRCCRCVGDEVGFRILLEQVPCGTDHTVDALGSVCCLFLLIIPLLQGSSKLLTPVGERGETTFNVHSVLN